MARGQKSRHRPTGRGVLWMTLSVVFMIFLAYVVITTTLLPGPYANTVIQPDRTTPVILSDDEETGK